MFGVFKCLWYGVEDFSFIGERGCCVEYILIILLCLRF